MVLTILFGLIAATECMAYEIGRYYQTPQTQSSRNKQGVQRHYSSNIQAYYHALAHGKDRRSHYSTPNAQPNRQGRVNAYHRHKDWVWVPSRNMWLMVSVGARTTPKPGQRPFGPLGIGQQPQIFNTRQPNGQEMLTDYFGNPYKAPKVLGYL